jgi:thiamine biosynthesis lipoprotein
MNKPVTHRPAPMLSTNIWQALGTTALVRVDDPDALSTASQLLREELEAIDRAASRFRADSELERVNARAGRLVRIGPLLHEAITVALRAAALTGGAVDPTLGEALRLAGYDRDFGELDHPDPDRHDLNSDHSDPDRAGYGQAAAYGRAAGASRPPAWTARVHRVRGWHEVRLFDNPPAVAIPAGMRLDLGATAKALAADRAAARVAVETGAGALVSLGGDIAVAGRVPPGEWLVHVTDDHRSGPDAPGQTVTISGGGLATSSTTTRRWRHGDRVAHHIVDPETGTPAAGPWRTVSVTAASCVDANIASTAAIVLGELAPGWLVRHGLAARLVDQGGTVLALGGWPH